MLDRQKIIEMYDGRAAVTYNLMRKVQPLLSQGYYIDNITGKIMPIMKGKSADPPWIYTRSHPDLNCTLWSEVMFQTVGIFPPACKQCWKVVVRPRTLMELFCLLEVQENFARRFCKCGIEVRDYVPALYGGYFYNRSKEEGLDCLQEVRALIAEHISPEVPVVLKRYCTEFELKFGPSNELEQTLERGFFIHPDEGKKRVMTAAEMEIWYAAVMKCFDIRVDFVPCECGGHPSCMKCLGRGYTAVIQPDIVKQNVIHRWFEWAWSHNDSTVREFFGGDNLYTPAVKYEPEKPTLPPGEVLV